MDTRCVDAIIAEVSNKATELVDPIEGAQDFLRLNIKEETRSIVQGRLDGFLRRKALIKTVAASARQLLADVSALVADGYPELAVEPVTATVFEDLQDQRRTESAFFALVSPPTVTTNVDAHVSEKRPTA